jgi:RimJ/RimL family protein N-acetyltransferase
LILQGPNVCLVPFDRRHFEATRAWANDLELSRLLDRARPISDVEHESWTASIHGREDCVFFAIETAANRHVGNVWLWAIDPRHRKAEVRIIIGETQSLGRGIGSEAIQLIADYARDRLNLRRLYAYVLGTNPRAKRAFEKAGFELEGTLRQERWVGDQYADVWLLGRVPLAA